MFVLVSIVLTFPVISQTKGPVAHLDNATFNRPNGKPFTEIYIQIPAYSLKFKPQDAKSFQAKAKITVKIKNKTSTIYDRSYTLNSPEIKDTQDLNFYINDQINIALEKEESYELHFSIADYHKPDKKAKAQKAFDTKLSASKMAFSDIKLIDTAYPTLEGNRFSMNNYTMIPNATNFVNKSSKYFYVYSESYKASTYIKDDHFYLHFILKKNEDTLLAKQEEIKTKTVNPSLAKLATNTLKGGKHRLKIEARDNADNLLASKTKQIYTQKGRSANLKASLKPYTKDSLEQFVKWHSPIANRKEAAFIKKFTDKRTPKDTLINFIVDFWKDENPRKPKQGWNIYKKKVHFVNDEYTNGINEGYQTDRGRVYLQYGAPNSIVRSQDDPNLYAYQIWHYNRTRKQANVKFIFYSTSILEEEFIILHSTAMGEYNNPNWKQDLNRNPNRMRNPAPWGNEPNWDFQK